MMPQHSSRQVLFLSHWLLIAHTGAMLAAIAERHGYAGGRPVVDVEEMLQAWERRALANSLADMLSGLVKDSELALHASHASCLSFLTPITEYTSEMSAPLPLALLGDSLYENGIANCSYFLRLPLKPEVWEVLLTEWPKCRQAVCQPAGRPSHLLHPPPVRGPRGVAAVDPTTLTRC